MAIGAIVTIVVGGAILATVVLRSSSSAEIEMAALPVEYRAAENRFDLAPRPNGEGADEIAEIVRDKVRMKAIDVVGEASAETLGDVVERRVELLLRPSFDDWVDHVERVGGVVPGLDEGGSLSPESMSKWSKGVVGLQSASVASEGIEVRSITIDEPFRMGVPGTRFMRPSSDRVNAAEYPPPAGEGRAVEVLIPVLFQPFQADRIPAKTAIRYFQAEGESDWRPFDLILYFDGQSMGKTLQFPVF